VFFSVHNKLLVSKGKRDEKDQGILCFVIRLNTDQHCCPRSECAQLFLYTEGKFICCWVMSLGPYPNLFTERRKHSQLCLH